METQDLEGTNTLEIISGRTHLGCHVYGHIRHEDGAQFITLATDPPPVLRMDKRYSAADKGGRVWPC